MNYLALFPGQGSQFVGMADKCLAKQPQLFKILDEVLNFPLTNLMMNGPLEKLTLTKWAQPAILTVSYACWLDRDQTKTYRCLLGHSLGELSALLCAEALDFTTAIFLSHKRGQFMQEAVPEGQGGMIAVIGQELSQVEDLCHETDIFVANYNGLNQIVVAGMVSNLEKFSELVAKLNLPYKLIPLKVSAPFHTPLLSSARQKFSEILSKVTFMPPRIPVLSNQLATLYPADSQSIATMLADQIVNPVRFFDCLKFATQTLSCDSFIEFGAGEVLTGLAKKSGFFSY
ncbi:MAG: ACP S-malonyltransferase [Deltaproteobacteria bacterium]|nr:ACP S-malonyltransferase [Deltaproteobacteria bacterium]